MPQWVNDLLQSLGASGAANGAADAAKAVPEIDASSGALALAAITAALLLMRELRQRRAL